MKSFFYNFGYFMKEIYMILRLNPISNLFSAIGTGLILFLLGIVITGWSIGNQLIITLQKEAEISAYFNTDIDSKEAASIVEEVKKIDGIRDARYIDEQEAESNMRELLGEEADVLELFHENPFEAYMEVNIGLENLDEVTASIKKINGIEYVRDNKEVLDLLRNITQGLTIVGLFIAIAVGVTTLIIISHMIRQGIYNNREQINTLKLLGAPSSFIGFPFVMAGLLLTIFGGFLAFLFLFIIIGQGYTLLNGNIPFIPLPPKELLVGMSGGLVLGISAILGCLGSLFGLLSIKEYTN